VPGRSARTERIPRSVNSNALLRDTLPRTPRHTSGRATTRPSLITDITPRLSCTLCDAIAHIYTWGRASGSSGWRGKECAGLTHLGKILTPPQHNKHRLYPPNVLYAGSACCPRRGMHARSAHSVRSTITHAKPRDELERTAGSVSQATLQLAVTFTFLMRAAPALPTTLVTRRSTLCAILQAVHGDASLRRTIIHVGPRSGSSGRRGR
jgi:hypothetical protein